jgi:hypothetical protein
VLWGREPFSGARIGSDVIDLGVAA